MYIKYIYQTFVNNCILLIINWPYFAQYLPPAGLCELITPESVPRGYLPAASPFPQGHPPPLPPSSPLPGVGEAAPFCP